MSFVSRFLVCVPLLLSSSCSFEPVRESLRSGGVTNNAAIVPSIQVFLASDQRPTAKLSLGGMGLTADSLIAGQVESLSLSAVGETSPAIELKGPGGVKSLQDFTASEKDLLADLIEQPDDALIFNARLSYEHQGLRRSVDASTTKSSIVVSSSVAQNANQKTKHYNLTILVSDSIYAVIAGSGITSGTFQAPGTSTSVEFSGSATVAASIQNCAVSLSMAAEGAAIRISTDVDAGNADLGTACAPLHYYQWYPYVIVDGQPDAFAFAGGGTTPVDLQSARLWGTDSAAQEIFANLNDLQLGLEAGHKYLFLYGFAETHPVLQQESHLAAALSAAFDLDSLPALAFELTLGSEADSVVSVETLLLTDNGKYAVPLNMDDTNGRATVSPASTGSSAYNTEELPIVAEHPGTRKKPDASHVQAAALAAASAGDGLPVPTLDVPPSSGQTIPAGFIELDGIPVPLTLELASRISCPSQYKLLSMSFPGSCESREDMPPSLFDPILPSTFCKENEISVSGPEEVAHLRSVDVGDRCYNYTVVCFECQTIANYDLDDCEIDPTLPECMEVSDPGPACAGEPGGC